LLPQPQRLRLRTLLWARWIAESINDFLPVAQIGGNLVRALLISRIGVAGATAGASVVVDLTTNFLAQLLFTVVGLCLLLFSFGGAPTTSVTLGIAIMTAALVGFFLVQRQGMFAFLARRIERMAWTPAWRALTSGAEGLDAVVRDLYRDRRAVVSATTWHFVSWLAGAVEIWVALHYLGHPLSLLAVVVMEALTEAVRTGAFLVPGAVGVQEGGYVIVGAWLGLTPDMALAVSLVKRVRELLLGVPGLVAWQLDAATGALRTSE
jgi:putative membrane protein